jgi:hypothetical protein
VKSSGETPSNLTESGDGVEGPSVRLSMLARKSYVPLNWKTGVSSSLISLSLKEKNPYLVAASSPKLAYVAMIANEKKNPPGTVQWSATI